MPRSSPWRHGGYRLVSIAETGPIFQDFAPYVASVNAEGRVAFQAALTDGRTGVYTGTGGPLATVVESGHDTGIRVIDSHPDINDTGAISVYGDTWSGRSSVLLIEAGRGHILEDSTGAFECIGPLGPTMNHSGAVAYRADRRSGHGGLFVAGGGRDAIVAEMGEMFRAFQGLPVIREDGGVVFRGDRQSGVQGIYLWSAGVIQTVVEIGDEFSQIGLFPSANDVGGVVFAATRPDGTSGIYVADVESESAVISTLVDTRHAPFESFRGALIDDEGGAVFFATPRGGQLGVFAGPNPESDRILGVGDALYGSTVAAFALNPVSINAGGQLAIRVQLTDNRQRILRADPSER